MNSGWHPNSWQQHPEAQSIPYDDRGALTEAVRTLGSLPPLVTSFEIDALKTQIAAAQRGERFVLQGGDCAETLRDCNPERITSTLKILLQMSLVILAAAKKPVVRIGRIAGQFAKPRSKPTETRVIDGREVTLPSYFGDLVNRAEFDPVARRPDPDLLLEGYKHAALTLNFIRSLTKGGFADLHHPEYWDLSFVERLPKELRIRYLAATEEITRTLAVMEAIGERKFEQLLQVELFTSHEGLNLIYESAQTRSVPHRPGWYCLTGHLPWIGERTRAVDGAHIAFFRGIENPIGVKLGPSVTPDEVLRLCDALNPMNEAGKLILITRLGAANVADRLPPLIRAVQREARRALWMTDPMHGNTRTTSSGVKTRNFDDIVTEIDATMNVHRAERTILGGIHFELTGDDVTECVGGAHGLSESDLATNYATACDPRLNYQQALEISFRIAERFRAM